MKTYDLLFDNKTLIWTIVILNIISSLLIVDGYGGI